MALSLAEITRYAELLQDQEKLALISELQRQLHEPSEIDGLWQKEVDARIKADQSGLLESYDYDELMAKYRS